MSDDVTAQDVIDAMRLSVQAQDNPAEAIRVVKVLLEQAPDSLSEGGANLIRDLVAEGSLTVEVAG